jgi:hypothetical protein
VAPNANFEEEEEESQSNHPRNDNECRHLLAWTQVPQQVTDCALDGFGVWQHSVDWTAHSRGNKPQCCFAGNFAFNQLTKCAQELLALRLDSVNSTPDRK